MTSTLAEGAAEAAEEGTEDQDMEDQGTEHQDMEPQGMEERQAQQEEWAMADRHYTKEEWCEQEEEEVVAADITEVESPL